jgi:hypothetical protein
MYRAKLKVTGARDLMAMHDTAIAQIKEIARECALATADEQQALILAEQAPDGSPQQEVSRKTRAIKGRQGVSPNVPLYRTGRLANPATWRIRKIKTGAVLRPPADREAAVAVLRSKGFKFVFERLPDSVLELAKKKMDELAARLTGGDR